MRFYASDITKALGVKRTTLQQWMERGFIEPSLQSGKGSGVRNIFSIGDLCRIAAFMKLLRVGLGREEAALWLRGFDFDEIARRKTGVMVIIGRFAPVEEGGGFFPLEMRFLEAPEATVRLSEGDDLAIVLNVGGIVEEVVRRIGQ